jgi:geranylgeranylglycerol-phosphate geranylgeranyltransferase
VSRRSVGGLVGSAVRFAAAAARGHASLGLPRSRFAGAVLESLRPHYFALPAGASLAGSASVLDPESPWPITVAAAAAGMGWGVGQLLNDLMDTEADALDAPQRAAVRGLLPEGPTVLVAMGLGIGVAALTLSVHPQAFWLALCATVLLLAYGTAKRTPLLGNIAHAALMATAACIGRAAATPRLALLDTVRDAWLVCALTGAWAAIYLQSNYEKDRRGDSRAGCRTLAHVTGLRLSAALRAASALPTATVAWQSGVLGGVVGMAAMGSAVALVLWSAALVLWHGTEASARTGYRSAVHGAALGMLAMGAPLLGAVGTPAAAVAAVLLIERAFRRFPGNP